MNNDSTLSKTGKKFIVAEKLKTTKKMPPIMPSMAMGMTRVLIKELGFFKAMFLLMGSFGWDFLFNKPKWHPEYFNFKNEDEEKIFKELFYKDCIYPLLIFQRLKRRFGEFLADEMMAKTSIPAGMSYLTKVFRPLVKVTHIDEIRQQMADYIGEGKSVEWTEEVSEDGTEVRYRFTKCIQMQIWRAYGMKSFVGYCCITDHVCFDNLMSGLVFGRKHTLGVGDDYCDHTFWIRRPEDAEKDESNYKDCNKVKFGARDAVRHWAEIFKINKGKFKFFRY